MGISLEWLAHPPLEGGGGVSLKILKNAHHTNNGAKSLRQRQWPPTLGHVYGNSVHDSLVVWNHKLQPFRTASKHIPVRP